MPVCISCKSPQPYRAFMRRNHVYKSCAGCSRRLARKRRTKKISAIVQYHCPVADVSNLIAELAVDSEETSREKKYVGIEIALRSVRVCSIRRLFNEDQDLQNAIAQIMVRGMDEATTAFFIFSKREFLEAYIRRKVMASRGRNYQELINDILHTHVYADGRPLWWDIEQ